MGRIEPAAVHSTSQQGGRSSNFSRRVEPAVARILIGPGRARGRSCDRVAAEGGRRSRLPRCGLDHSYARPHFFRNISGGLSSRRGAPPFWSGQVEPAVVYATGSQQRGVAGRGSLAVV